MTILDRRLALAALTAAALALPAAAQEKAVGPMTIGAADAPVTITEYSSLTCPYCARYHEEAWPEIKEKYVDTGQLRVEFQEVYFDQPGLWASMIARCGGETAFFPYVDAFYAQQEQWARSEDVAQELMRIGRLGGLSNDALQACLADESYMRALVEQYRDTAGAAGVEATPSFMIGGELHRGFRSAAEMSALIEADLEDAGS